MTVRWVLGDRRAEVLAELGVAAVTHECARCGATDHGRPRPLGAEGGDLDLGLSLARAGDLVLAAVADGPVGVDLEPLGGAAAREVTMHPSERGDPLRAWVRKEALLKATGLGLLVAPESFWIGPDGRPSAIEGYDGPALVVRDLDVEGHRAALAVAG